jgi:catechol 2,3-dioxygenase-like lactoylglutathione lyase family enzyme
LGIAQCRLPARAQQAAPGPAPLVGINHIPFAVRNLEQAVDTYRRLGFRIKPGHLHADGIRNNHVKFADGAGVELITAPAATDELTGIYTRMISQGDGPGYVSFHSATLEPIEAAAQRLAEAYSVDEVGILTFRSAPLQWLFLFAGSNRSPTDRPEYFAHPNGANATVGVWIAGTEQEQQQDLRLFAALGARIECKSVRVPDPLRATVATVANGEVIFLPAHRQLLPGRPIIGIVFRTNSLSAARHALQVADVTDLQSIETNGYKSIVVAPRHTHGAWLEFRAT